MEIRPKENEIEMPTPTPMGFIIAVLATKFGFAIIWHIWWLAALALAAIVVCLVVRSFGQKIEEPMRI